MKRSYSGRLRRPTVCPRALAFKLAAERAGAELPIETVDWRDDKTWRDAHGVLWHHRGRGWHRARNQAETLRVLITNRRCYQREIAAYRLFDAMHGSEDI